MRSKNRADQELGGHLERFWAGEGGGAEGAVGGRRAVVEGSGVEGDGWDEVEVWGDEIEEAEEVGLSTFSGNCCVSPIFGNNPASLRDALPGGN